MATTRPPNIEENDSYNLIDSNHIEYAHKRSKRGLNESAIVHERIKRLSTNLREVLNRSHVSNTTHPQNYTLPVARPTDQLPEAITVHQLSGTPPTRVPRKEYARNYQPLSITSTDYKQDEYGEDEREDLQEDEEDKEEIAEDEEVEEDKEELVEDEGVEEDKEEIIEDEEESADIEEDEEENADIEEDVEGDKEEIREEDEEEDKEELQDEESEAENENIQEDEEEDDKEELQNDEEEDDKEELQNDEEEHEDIVDDDEEEKEDIHFPPPKTDTKPIYVPDIDYTTQKREKDFRDVEKKEELAEEDETQVDPKRLENFKRHFIEVDDINEQTELISESETKSDIKNADDQPANTSEAAEPAFDEEAAKRLAEAEEEANRRFHEEFESLHEYEPILLETDDDPEALVENDDDYDKFRKNSKNDYLVIKKGDFRNANTPYEIELGKDFYKRLEDLYDEADEKYENLEAEDEEEEEEKGEQTGKSEIRLKKSPNRRQFEDNVQVESDKTPVSRLRDVVYPKRLKYVEAESKPIETTEAPEDASDRPENVDDAIGEILKKKDAISRHQNIENDPRTYSNYWSLEYVLPH